MGAGCSRESNYCQAIISRENFARVAFDQANNLVDLNDPAQVGRVGDTLNVVFNSNLAQLLGLTNPAVSISLNPLTNGPTFGSSIPLFSGNVSYSINMPVLPSLIGLPTYDINYKAEFPMTNTSQIQIKSLSILNYSPNCIVSVNTQTLNPLDSFQVSVELDLGNFYPDINGSVSAYPILLYDAGNGWQSSLTSPDYPVLGGFVAGLGIDWTGTNPYGSSGQFFSSYQSDTSLGEVQGTLSSLGISYYAPQNVYSTGEASAQNTLSQLFITSLV